MGGEAAVPRAVEGLPGRARNSHEQFVEGSCYGRAERSKPAGHSIA